MLYNVLSVVKNLCKPRIFSAVRLVILLLTFFYSRSFSSSEKQRTSTKKKEGRRKSSFTFFRFVEFRLLYDLRFSQWYKSLGNYEIIFELLYAY